MKSSKAQAVLFGFTLFISSFAQADIIKKSRSDICHDSSSPFYERTTNFEPFDTMEGCLKSGGRLPRTPGGQTASNKSTKTAPSEPMQIQPRGQIQDFNRAKRLLTQMYKDNPELSKTLYCEAPVNWQGNRGVPNLAVIGYEIRKQPHRAGRNEFEHVMPSHHIEG